MIGIRNFYLKKKKEKGGKTISLSHSLITATNTLYHNLLLLLELVTQNSNFNFQFLDDDILQGRF
jgi:hypothetical protein